MSDIEGEDEAFDMFADLVDAYEEMVKINMVKSLVNFTREISDREADDPYIKEIEALNVTLDLALEESKKNFLEFRDTIPKELLPYATVAIAERAVEIVNEI